MGSRMYDRAIEHENYVDEVSCCECGFHRNGAHHPKIRCPKTGRCGECGNDWPCEDHAIAEYLRKMVDRSDLAMASHVLPADHPLRPAIKQAMK